MKSLKSICVALCAALVLAGCGMSKTGQGALIGAGGGAGLGAIVGALAGNTAIGAAIGTAVGAGAGAIIGKKMDKAKKEAEAIQNAQVEEVTDANGLDAVKMTFDSGILFNTGKADLSAASKSSLQQLATVLKNNSDCDVAIQGYTDNQGWKNSTAEQSAQKNQALSLDRATAVSSYLQALSVPVSQIKSVEGFGQSNPVADNSTKAGQAQNRRVEVYMYALSHHWVSIDKISPNLPKAVMGSEDAKFLAHHGFDYEAIEHAAKRNRQHPEKRKLGASTISQQTAKNVFLWPGRSWVRKGFEVYFTTLIEFMWPKQRIMEVYLNSIEMGDGIYGADAVAEEHFDTDALHLTKAQCALIAATLPNPRKFSSKRPSPYILKRQARILREMRFVPDFPK